MCAPISASGDASTTRRQPLLEAITGAEFESIFVHPQLEFDLTPIRVAGRSLLCDDRRNAIIQFVADVELHDEVVDWLATLDGDHWDRMVVVLDRLVSLGSTARMPMSKALGDGLFELRVSLGSSARRVTYRFTRDGRIILLTTFRKQRNNERAEIDRARRAAKRCAERNP